MADDRGHLAQVGAVADTLANLGLEPILVGGMALVIMGSRRVTRDFDFVIASPGDRIQLLVDAMYRQGFELAARVNEQGDVSATIDNPRVASVRLRLDAPSSAYFVNSDTGLRIDLLFDFPIPAATLARRAIQMTIRTHTLRVASEADLLRLKQIARANRNVPGDAEDVAFLEGRRRKRKTGDRKV
jgi:hypothetical protein